MNRSSFTKSLLLITLFYQWQKVQCQNHPKPIFSNARDALDLNKKDYYDELQYPDIKNEKILYIRGSNGGISTMKPILKPNIPPDIEPIDNLQFDGELIKVGRIKGKSLWNEKTENKAVSGTQFEVKTEGMGRTVKGIVIDMTKVKHNGYRTSMRVENGNYFLVIKSSSALQGIANIKYYTNPPWKKQGQGRKKNQGNKGNTRPRGPRA